MTAEERANRLRTLCLRYWNASKRDLAADAFEQWLETDPESPSRQEALDSNKKLDVPDLEDVCAYWRKRQCPPIG
jgi:hypothetical protein